MFNLSGCYQIHSNILKVPCYAFQAKNILDRDVSIWCLYMFLLKSRLPWPVWKWSPLTEKTVFVVWRILDKCDVSAMTCCDCSRSWLPSWRPGNDKRRHSPNSATGVQPHISDLELDFSTIHGSWFCQYLNIGILVACFGLVQQQTWWHCVTHSVIPSHV